MADAKITMYVRPGCPDVARARVLMQQRGLAWDEIDIEQDGAARQQVEQWNGGRAITPTLWIGDTLLSEPDGTEIDAALGRAAAR